MLIELPSTLAGAEKLGSVGRSGLRQPYAGLANPHLDREPLGFQFLALGKEWSLASCGSRLMETNVKD
jgi:hypothetical protein